MKIDENTLKIDENSKKMQKVEKNEVAESPAFLYF